MWDATIGAEVLVHISGYIKRFQRTKIGKVSNLAQRSLKNGRVSAPVGHALRWQ